MRASRPVEQALRLATSSSTQSYVCKSCRAQAARQFHTSVPHNADVSFFQQLRQTLFGSKESLKAEEVRTEKQKQRSEELQAGDGVGEVGTKVGRDGQVYEVAAVVDPTIRKDYVQAMNWDGLERVGSVEWVRARADRGEAYVGFVPRSKAELSRKQWQMLLHNIMVEVLVLQKAGRPAGQVCYPRQPGSVSAIHTRRGNLRPKAAGTAGEIKLTFSEPAAQQQILSAIPETLSSEQGLDEQTLLGEVQAALAEVETQDNITSNSVPLWMDVSLRDPAVKMALLKRILQLTGKRLSDPAMSTSHTLADIYDKLLVQPKPTKLAQTKEIRQLHSSSAGPLGNVTFKSNRQTPIHKERAVGRWKVIEEELVARDLPVTGSRWQGAKTTV